MKRREIAKGIRITFSCQSRPPLLSNPKIADLFVDQLAWAHCKHGFELLAWVVMPEHVHLLVRPAMGAVLETALRSLKISISMRVIARWQKVTPEMIVRIANRDGSPRFGWLGVGLIGMCDRLQSFSGN